jgi:hypothetical protein
LLDFRDWMDAHHPRLFALWCWPGYRLFGRCLACDQWVILHSPWALYICERTPLPIEITEQGRQRLAESVVPESQAVA